MRKILVGLVALLLPAVAHAQSTAQLVTPGFLTTSGCPLSQTVCFVPYSNANPLPVTGGGGGAATIANGADVVEGTIGDTQATGTVVGYAKSGYTTLGTIATNTTNAGTPTLQSGSAIVGKFGIDQTTPGTTNGVVVNSSALPTGASTSALQSNVQAAPTASTPATVNFVESVDVTGAQPNFGTAVPVTLSSNYPSGAVPVSCSTGNVAAATATCTLPATSGKTTYVTGFDISGSGATVGSVVTCTITNTGSGTHSYTYAAAAGALIADTPVIKSFPIPLVATATNTSPVLSCPSLGTGNTNMTINMDGFEQ